MHLAVPFLTFLAGDSFLLQLWVVTQVDNDAKAITGRVPIVVNVGAMFVSDLFVNLEHRSYDFVTSSLNSISAIVHYLVDGPLKTPTEVCSFRVLRVFRG